MLFAPEVLETLWCPVTKNPLRVMTPREIQGLNSTIAEGGAKYADGAPVTEALENGVATTDGAFFYAIREGVPVLLPEQRIVGNADAARVAGAKPGTTRGGAWAKYWEYASQHWDDLRPPRRPSPADTALLERIVGAVLPDGSPTRPRALLLGVTQEIATMRWPNGTRLLALDSSMAMICNLWPGRSVPDSSVVCGDWLTMPVRDATYDVVVGDASVSAQPYPESFFAILAEVTRVLKDDGVLATRAFTRPEEREPLDTIFADLLGGRIGTLDFLRWRLASALHGDRATGARMGDMWDAWEANVPDPLGLMRSLGWPPDAARAMETLRGGNAILTFPTLRELRDDLRQSFEEVACEAPDFEDGDRYPTLLLRRKPRSHVRTRT